MKKRAAKPKPASSRKAKATKATKATKKPAPPTSPNVKFVQVAEVAAALNLGERRVQQLVKEGFPRAKRGLYDLDASFRFYVRYLQRKLIERALPDDGDGDGGGPATSAGVMRHRLLSIEAEMKQIELAEKREQLISVDRVEKDFAALAMEIKTRILSLPPRLAAEVLGERDLAIAQTKIERSLKGALESLAQYDPDDRVA
jgi:phage terminase Nu1 subunit (DNA packaging protein)